MEAHNALRKARDLIVRENGVIAPIPISEEEELNPDAQDDLSYGAIALERTTHCYRVKYSFPDDSSYSNFSFFEDGRQRTLPIGFIPARISETTNVLIPVHFFVVAAVILQRHCGQLKVWRRPEIEMGVLVDKSLLPDEHVLRECEEGGLKVVDIGGVGGDYHQLRKYALQKAKALRLAAEDRLIGEWRHSAEASNSFLVVDGTLMNFRNEENVEKCVGVSKSFGSRYFSLAEHNRIMQMNEFERSWTFRFHSLDNDKDDLRLGVRERISWYLRLRRRPNTDPEFGLVRVEISQRHADRAGDYAEEFSRSLLSERLPTSYPVPRWHNHLYPINVCENYLSSIMPSVSTISAFMKG
jgi:hypothetical protein